MCENFTLPSGGQLFISPGNIITLSANAIYQPNCTSIPPFLQNNTLPLAGDRDPFYASVVPLVYVVAGCTFVAWFLFIILLLLPGSYIGITRRRPVRTWRPTWNIWRYIMDRPRTGSSRPWLQKVAAFLVVLALTTVTADTFRYAQRQYDEGYMDADDLRQHVTRSYEVRIIRVLSDLFLWLAQIQTLIRLFPRHKEKLIIKWIGFLLILLDLIFSCVNTFLVDVSYSAPLQNQDAVSALSYLFQLSMNLLYAAWVLYYALTKRKYAFYHPLMPSICIIALFSVLSILIPVVFFLVDIVELPVSTWGDYFRWLGSAASSIVVWEWVERIEALERDEKRDGILGREVFDEDETDDHTVSDASSRTTSLDLDRGYSSDSLGASKNRQIARWRALTERFPNVRLPRKRKRLPDDENVDEKVEGQPTQNRRSSVRTGKLEIAYPARAASPVDRKQTTSTGSTVYAVHYHPVVQTPPTTLQTNGQTAAQANAQVNAGTAGDSDGQTAQNGAADSFDTDWPQDQLEPLADRQTQTGRARWSFATNPFRRSRKSPPIEIKNAMSSLSEPGQEGVDSHDRPPLVIGRTGLVPVREREEAATPPSESRKKSSPQEPTIIAAPARGQLWSPSTQTHSPIDLTRTPESLIGSMHRHSSTRKIRASSGATSSSKTTGSNETQDAPGRPNRAHSTTIDFGNRNGSGSGSGNGTTPPPAGQGSGSGSGSSEDSHEQASARKNDA